MRRAAATAAALGLLALQALAPGACALIPFAIPGAGGAGTGGTGGGTGGTGGTGTGGTGGTSTGTGGTGTGGTGTGTGGGTGGGCTTAAMCDDGNPCTTDACSAGSCTHTPVAAGTGCGSTNVCSGVQTCDSAGTCKTTPPPVIDDGNPCTTDACDPATGNVTHTPIARCWTPLPTAGAPSARADHTAVWTGSQMIVWGGTVDGHPGETATGGVYDPQKGWRPTATAGAPAARASHVAVWAGSKMIVWGGYDDNGYRTDGAVYDPATDAWSAIATAGAPSPRTNAVAVWTGSVLVIWGGKYVTQPSPIVLADGAAYDPSKDKWTALPASGAPSARYDASAVWTSSRVIIWGGYDFVNWFQTGASYDPVAGAWTGATPVAGAPEYRQGHAAVWSGSRMVIWGGLDPNTFIATGGALDPVTGTWTALATTGAPAPREYTSALWTGSAMFVWGGCGGQNCDPLGDGALWAPGANGGTWTAIPANAAIAGRSAQAAVWTGSSAIVWGGKTAQGRTATGAVFTP